MAHGGGVPTLSPGATVPLSLCFCLIARTQEMISAALEVAGPRGCQAQLTTMVNFRVHEKEGSEIMQNHKAVGTTRITHAYHSTSFFVLWVSIVSQKRHVSFCFGRQMGRSG